MGPESPAILVCGEERPKFRMARNSLGAVQLPPTPQFAILSRNQSQNLDLFKGLEDQPQGE
jgi:hypothetical protein